MLARDEIIEVLFQALSDLKCVKAAWLAGSDAFNRADKWSDVDLRAVSSPDEFDAVFSAIENALKKISEIELMYVVPKSPTYAHRHRFYRLKNALPFNFVDFWCLQKEGLEEFLHPVRQGIGPVLFDREGIVESHRGSDQELLEGFSERIKDIEMKFQMFGRMIVEKSVKRGHFTDAVFQYHHRVLLPTIEVIRAVYSLLRQDFGQRYLVWDLPDDIRLD
jgi:hypothetical protein